ncbi:MAG: serine hydrolase [Spongiibacteraceae bacterium]|jgi:CubicO group peptidase (beta-lactamase class C family)|nr:serine hydrolase [Spongiibacteraceae bacterium]
MRKTVSLMSLVGCLLAPVTALAEVPDTVAEMRRLMLDARINALTFSSMDRLFTTRTVPRAGEVWQLPRREQALDFSYSAGGQQFQAEQMLERTFTNALMIVKDGVVVYQNHLNRTGPDTRYASWSMAKSIVSLLVGIAVEEGLIDISKPIVHYLPELKGGGYDGATVQDVLEMRSGVDYEERYDFENPGIAAENHEMALVRNERRFADAAMGIARAHKPGEHFAYKTIDTAVLGWLLERVTQRNVSSYMAEKLWEPLGAERDGFWIMDGPVGEGREFTGAGFNATLADYARIGQMVLDGGKANGRQIVSAAWISESTRPRHPESEMGGYAYQWWTVPNSDAFYALGLQGQFIYIDPQSRTVVVKLSHFPPGDDFKVMEETLAFMAAAARWQPKQ